jgi:sugar phosphate isomerase/epimerase
VDWHRFASLLREISYNKVVVVESVEKVPESVQKLKSIIGYG